MVSVVYISKLVQYTRMTETFALPHYSKKMGLINLFNIENLTCI